MLQLIKFCEENECMYNVSLTSYHNPNKKKTIIAHRAHIEYYSYNELKLLTRNGLCKMCRPSKGHYPYCASWKFWNVLFSLRLFCRLPFLVAQRIVKLQAYAIIKRSGARLCPSGDIQPVDTAIFRFFKMAAICHVVFWKVRILKLGRTRTVHAGMTKVKNNSGHRTDPWVTPYLITPVWDSQFSNTVYCCLLFR